MGQVNDIITDGKYIVTDSMLEGWDVTRKEFQDGLIRAGIHDVSAKVEGETISAVVREIRRRR